MTPTAPARLSPNEPAALDPGAVADDLAARLHTPPTGGPPLAAQSLAAGAAGIALLHIERAHTGHEPWATAHTFIRSSTTTGVAATDDASLYLGAPALSFVLHTADTDQAGRYRRAQHTMDRAVTDLTHRRIDAAQQRISRGELPRTAEFDVIRGLTGIGAHLLKHAPSSDAMGRILAYLVRLTLPLHHHGTAVPGWWTRHDPSGRTSDAFAGGHGNLGMAHGIAGPLALLSLALRRGVTVDGHRDAIARICRWMDTYRRSGNGAWWWPQWITLDEHTGGYVLQRGPMRPSWCYGTAGVARAHQLAALATGDTARQEMAELAMTACITDPASLHLLTDSGLCHGWAGLHQAAWRATRDSATPELAAALPQLTDRLVRHARTELPQDSSFLDGAAGTALALHTAAHQSAPLSGWDACLLLA
jgi:hypothetical protein